MAKILPLLSRRAASTAVVRVAASRRDATGPTAATLAQLSFAMFRDDFGDPICVGAGTFRACAARSAASGLVEWMADRFSGDPASPEAAAREARRATAELFARISAHHRRKRRRSRFLSRSFIVDIVVAMATYAGLTLAVILGVIYSIRTAVDLLNG